MEPLTPGKLLTEKEVAKILGVHPRTLQNWRYKKKGPRCINVGRHIRYPSADLVAWVEKGGTKRNGNGA